MNFTHNMITMNKGINYGIKVGNTYLILAFRIRCNNNLVLKIINEAKLYEEISHIYVSLLLYFESS